MRTQRNLSVIEYFRRKSITLEPKYRFKGQTTQDFKLWKTELLIELKKLLGPFPDPVPLNPEIVWEIEHDGLLKRRVLLDTEADMSVAALLYIPQNAKKKPAPAILCNHGHGEFGKNTVMGVRSQRNEKENIAIDRGNGDYGLQMAKQGYVTLAIDWRGFGERSDYAFDYDAVPYPGRDRCDIHFHRGSLMGVNLLTLDIFDGIRMLDYLCSLECVDAGRIGAMGCSFGGTMTTWLAALDERVKAADVICYSARFKNFAIGHGNVCGSQYVPGLYTLCDLPDLQGLIAPRPLLAEVGVYDDCFFIEDALSCCSEVEKIYRSAGAAQGYEKEIFYGEHQFSGVKAFGFFDKHLKGKL